MCVKNPGIAGTGPQYPYPDHRTESKTLCRILHPRNHINPGPVRETGTVQFCGLEREIMSVRGIGFTYKTFNFPTGEKHVKIEDIDDLPIINIELNFEKNEDIIELLLLCDAVKEIALPIESIIIPYVPFSRQDRINSVGESFSLRVFCNLINSIGAKRIYITDPHSDVTPALLNNCVVTHQHEVFGKYFRGIGVHCLVCPDGGALKKIYKLATLSSPSRVIECSKIRNTSNGEITGVKIHDAALAGRDFYIVDDICDGGRTFVEIAKVLRDAKANKVVLMVTHGFFTKGLGVFDGLIDEIYTLKGRVK